MTPFRVSSGRLALDRLGQHLLERLIIPRVLKQFEAARGAVHDVIRQPAGRETRSASHGGQHNRWIPKRKAYDPFYEFSHRNINEAFASVHSLEKEIAMMIPQMSDLEAPISNEALDALEQRLSVRLPANYRRWLLSFNGGNPTPGTFRYKYETGPGTSGQVSYFLGVHSGPYCNFERSYRFWKVQTRRIPGGLVPIAEDALGNRVCLAFAGPLEGKVYFWDHEMEADEGEPATFANCHLVADTFEEFLDALAQPIPGEAEAILAERKALSEGSFPPEVERQCRIVEQQHPQIRRWVRTLALELFEAKTDFCFHDDPTSLLFLDLVFWMKQLADGPNSAHIEPLDSDTIMGWFRRDSTSFGLGGYAPGFVYRWMLDRAKKGLLKSEGTTIAMTPETMALIPRRLAEHVAGSAS